MIFILFLFLFVIVDEPRSVKEAVNFEERKLWKKARVEEMEALEKNQAWNFDKFPYGRKHVGSKQVFKIKLNATGKVEKYKSQLVAKRCSKVEGIDFGELFSPIAKLTSIRFALPLTMAFDIQVEQLYVKTTFLYGDLDENYT